MQPSTKEEVKEEAKDDCLDITLTQPENNQNIDNQQDSNAEIIGKSHNDITDSKEYEHINNNNDLSQPPVPPQRQSISPSKNQFLDDSNSIINNCAVLIIPLDNRVTPQMVSNKFVKYGKILQVRPIKGSSTCIVIFSKPSEANNCIRLFENHDKVRVTRPEQL